MSGKDSGNWRPSASRLALESRATLLAGIRSFFAEHNVLEVETAILSKAGNSDPNISGLRTDSIPHRYLRTSPEYPMKRLLASGLTNIYELGRVFRARENGAWHNPEFTLLEWYHKDWNYLDLAIEVVDLIRYCGPDRFGKWPARRVSYRDLFIQYTGLDPFLADDADWSILAGERGINTGQLDHLQWLDLVMSLIIQPALDPECILTVYDYPPEQAALACIRHDATPVAERFEIYLGRVELANGYQELGDAAEQLQRFERENRLRKIQGEDPPPIDTRLIKALENGFPHCAGVALGVDRLLMCLLELEDISAVLAFPHDRA